MGGPLVDRGRITGATGENCGVEKVGNASTERPPLGELSPNVMAAIERMSMSPDPSVLEDAEGTRTLAAEGTAKASRLASENRTEFSLRCPVRWVVLAPLPPDERGATGSAVWGATPPNKNGEVVAGTACAGAAAGAAAAAKRSAVPAGETTVGAAKGSASSAGAAAAATALTWPVVRGFAATG